MFSHIGKVIRIKKIVQTMGHRITVMVDDENFKKLRILQSKLLKQTDSSVSFSRVLNDTISNCLKKVKEN